MSSHGLSLCTSRQDERERKRMSRAVGWGGQRRTREGQGEKEVERVGERESQGERKGEAEGNESQREGKRKHLLIP